MAKSNVSTLRPEQSSSDREHNAKVAIADLYEQLARAYALVSGAKARLDGASDDQKDLSAIQLLDMAEDELGEMKHVNRLAENLP